MSSSDFSKPVTTDTYGNVLAEITASTADLAMALDPATTSAANQPINTVRWNSANIFWEKFNGTVWGALASVYSIVVAQSVKLQTTRAIALTGDISGTVNFDGSTAVSMTTTLPNVNTNPGSIGTANAIPVITSNAKGQITAITTTSLSNVSQLSNDSAYQTVSGTVASLTTATWIIQEVGGKLVFKKSGAVVASMGTDGTFTSVADVVAFGTP